MSPRDSLSIEGTQVCPLRVIAAGGGAVLHMLRPGMALLPGRATVDGESRIALGELYFSEVLPGQVKAWKRHARQTQHFAVPCGRLGLALYDARPGPPTRGRLETLAPGRGALYALVRIPPGVLYGFTALGGMPALVCNAADLPHDPAEGEKVDPLGPEGGAIPFDWSLPFPEG